MGRAFRAAVAVVLLATATACASDDGDSTSSDAPTTSAAPTTRPTVVAGAPAAVEITAVYEEVEFYPACGNETLTHRGVVWHPVVHVGLEPMDAAFAPLVAEVLAVEREPSPVGRPRGLARVAPPGPGDDAGTLVVWADGVARWVSKSGDLDVLMIDDTVTYNWIC